MPTLQVPPGRMGRSWLQARLELAERGVSLLEEKLRLLADRHDVLQRRAEQAERAWHDAYREADTWALRATLLGGQRAIALAAPREQAAVTIEWATTVGARYPDRAQSTFPPDGAANVHTNSATVQASQTHRAAVVAAAEHATAQAALATIAREYGATRLRARALSKHWLPRLRDALARINLELEEQDRAEATRLRLVELGRGQSATGGAQLRVKTRSARTRSPR